MFLKFKKIDLPIIAILVVFMIASGFIVYSAMLSSSITFNLNKMILIYVVSLIAFLGTSMIDYRFLVKIWPYLYTVGVLLLIGVYFFGVEVYGAKGWFRLGAGFDFQPVELFKFILIISLAAFMARRGGEKLELLRDVLPIGLLVFIPFALVAIQPDLGNAVILIVILIGMYWIGNIRASYVLIGTAITGAFIYGFYYLFKFHQDAVEAAFKALSLPGHWLNRLNTFVNPELASSDQTYQVNNAMRAIGSGGLLGEGYLQGTSTQSSFIPVAYTDSIFVVVGEELGFVGASLLLLLYFVLIYRMILIAISSYTLSGSYMIIGIISMFVFQVFENVGAMLGLMPLTGITLPFISYGGTSLMINMMAMGLVMSVKLHNDKPLGEV